MSDSMTGSMSTSTSTNRDGANTIGAYSTMMKKAKEAIAANKTLSHSSTTFKSTSSFKSSYSRGSSVPSKPTITAAIEDAQRNMLAEDLKKQALDAYVATESSKILAELKPQLEAEVKDQLRKELAETVKDELRQSLHDEVYEELRNNEELSETIKKEVTAAHKEALEEQVYEECYDSIRDELVETGVLVYPEDSSDKENLRGEPSPRADITRRDSGSSTSVIDPAIHGSQIDLTEEDSDEEQSDAPNGQNTTIRPTIPSASASLSKKRSFDEASDGEASTANEEKHTQKKQLTEALLTAAKDADKHVAAAAVAAAVMQDSEDQEEEEEGAGNNTPDGLPAFGAFAKYGDVADADADNEDEDDGSANSDDYVRDGEVNGEEGQGYDMNEYGSEGEDEVGFDGEEDDENGENGEYEEEYEEDEGEEEMGKIQPIDPRITQEAEVIDLLSD